MESKTAEELVSEAKHYLSSGDNKFWIYPEDIITLVEAGAKFGNLNSEYSNGFTQNLTYKGLNFITVTNGKINPKNCLTNEITYARTKIISPSQIPHSWYKKTKLKIKKANEIELRKGMEKLADLRFDYTRNRKVKNSEDEIEEFTEKFEVAFALYGGKLIDSLKEITGVDSLDELVGREVIGFVKMGLKKPCVNAITVSAN